VLALLPPELLQRSLLLLQRLLDVRYLAHWADEFVQSSLRAVLGLSDEVCEYARIAQQTLQLYRAGFEAHRSDAHSQSCNLHAYAPAGNRCIASFV